MLSISILGSGSSGNSAVVCLGDDTRILVDAGLSAKQLCLRLEARGIDPDSLSGIVLTHEHGDHVCGLDVFLRKRDIPIFATRDTSYLVAEKLKGTASWQIFESGSAFRVGDVMVESFSVPHDASDPVGFVFRGKQTSIGVLSDVGNVTQVIIDRLRGVDTLFTESNYDEVMLQNDTKRPWATKQRISNRHGHLSNHQTADLVSQIASEKLCRVLLGHLSSDCNTPDLAKEIISDRLVSDGFTGIEVECADRKEPTLLHPATTRVQEMAHHQTVVKVIGERSDVHQDKVVVGIPGQSAVSSDVPSQEDSVQTEWVF